MTHGPFSAAALQYVKSGFFPIPVKYRGKQALIRWKHLQSKGVSPGRVERLRERFPSANIALLTGVPSSQHGEQRLVVFDADSREGLDLLKRYKVPKTASVETGRGQHLYYLADTMIPTRRIADGLDVKCARAYVLAPGSVHPNGHQYEWTRPLDAITEIPPALLELALESPHTRIPKGADRNTWVTDLIRTGLPGGARNDLAAKLVGYFARPHPHGLPADVTFAIFQKIPHEAHTHEFSDEELRGVIDSIYAREAIKNCNLPSNPIWCREGANFAPLPLSECTFQEMPGSALKVYVVLVGQKARFGQNFHMLQSEIAEETGLSERTVISALQYLEKVRLVEKTFRGFNIRGVRLASRFALLHDVIHRLRRLDAG